MKILIIYPTLTHPVNAGNKHWAMAQVELLRSLGHEVYMVCLNVLGLREDRIKNSKELAITKEYWGNHGFILEGSLCQRIKSSLVHLYRKRSCNGYYKCDDLYPNILTAYVKKLHKKHQFDACIVNYYWLTKVFEKVSFPITAVNTHDVFSYRDQVLDSRNAWMCTTPNEEAKGLQRARFVFSLQDEESAFFSHLAPKSRILNVYCPFEIKPQEPVFNHNLVILAAAGSLNLEGIEWFITSILPSIIREFPDINFVIGGRICNLLDKYRNLEHIQLIGEVNDPSDLYKLGDVSVNPCINGTGLKIKTFEALSYGKVVMVHPHSTIGIYKRECAPVFASTRAEEWVSYLKLIWRDKENVRHEMAKSVEYIRNMNHHIESQYELLEK